MNTKQNIQNHLAEVPLKFRGLVDEVITSIDRNGPANTLVAFRSSLAIIANSAPQDSPLKTKITQYLKVLDPMLDIISNIIEVDNATQN